MVQSDMFVAGAAGASQAGASSFVVHWRTVRKLYPFYAALVQRLGLGEPLQKDLGQAGDACDPQLIAEISRWLEEVDQLVQPHHLRQFLQESDLTGCEDTLHALIDQILGKENKTDSDRDKLDYLLVQFFTASAPPSFQTGNVSRENVAEVLEPLLGGCASDLPDWLESLDELRARLEKCESVGELSDGQLISQGRELKKAAGASYFAPKTLVAFTHFNYCLRRELARIMNADLEFVGESLDKLQARGVESIDCRSAGFSEKESVLELKKRWASWEIPIDLRYSKDSFLLPLLSLRQAVEVALRPFGGSELDQICEGVAQLRRSLVSMTSQMKKVSAEIRRQAIPRMESPNAQPSTPGAREVEATVESAAEAAEPAAEAETAVSNPPAAEAPDEPATPAEERAESAPPVVSFDLDERVSKVKEALGTTVRRKAAISLAVGGTRVLLTPSEVGAFLERGGGVAHTIRRTVALRLALVEALETYKQERSTSSLPELVKLGRAEYDQAQSLIAKCGAAHKDEQGESLAASARQLAAMLQRGERLIS